MKRLIQFFIVILCAFASANADDVMVTMKNGTVFKGELKEFAPTDHVTVIVAGIETEIPISEVASVEKADNKNLDSSNQSADDSKLQYGKYVITETTAYPESFSLKIGNQEFTMVLVKGGWFNMGYDGRHSLSWDSEPVHRVTLSSYYVSKQLLNHNTADILFQKKKISNNQKPYICKQNKDVDMLIEKIRDLAKAPYRLLTEAEWEYLSLMRCANEIFRDNSFEWCSDIWEKYSAADQINPQGPTSGKYHVIRSYSTDNNKWKRYKNDWQHFPTVRIAISADQINQTGF